MVAFLGHTPCARGLGWDYTALDLGPCDLLQASFFGMGYPVSSEADSSPLVQILDLYASCIVMVP